MTQQEILNYLRKNEKGTSQEIADSLGVSRASITRATRTLVRFNEIRFREVKINNNRQFIFYPLSSDITIQELKK